MSALFSGTFRSLRTHNFRVWSAGAIVSNIGTWMQRTAQDWLVLTQLTHHNATAVGIVMALQFGPQLLMLPWTGYVADHLDRRKLMLATQGIMGVLALGLGVLTVTHVVQLWQVYIFAFLFGCTSAFDAPARQIFVNDLVQEKDVPNAVGLNSTSFNAGRMIGPAAAGLTIAAFGTGWAFLLNGLSFIAVVASLLFLRVHELQHHQHTKPKAGGLADGFRYVAKRPDLVAMLVMVAFIGTFGFNFAIFIATMAVSVFHVGAGKYGLLSSAMALGTLSGALLAAGRERPTFGLLVGGVALFGVSCALAALMPDYELFAASLVVTGIAAMTFANTSNTVMQLTTDPAMRGRVMAIRLAIMLGGTPIGAPIVGWVADHFGPRYSLGVAALSGVAATAVGLYYLSKHENLRVYVRSGRLRVITGPEEDETSDPLRS
ncbi:MAG TPA: MFS transporter [Rhizomicrobium sp.]